MGIKSDVSKAMKGKPKSIYAIYLRERGGMWKRDFWVADVKAYNKEQAKTQYYANRGFRKLDKKYVIARIIKRG